MRVLFCKISAMKYYKGASEKDPPFNGGSFVTEEGYGHEEYNFDAVALEDGDYCLGYVSTKNTSGAKDNQLRIERIAGCEHLKNADSVDDVLVIWCATTDRNQTSVMGWYKNATVYREYQRLEFDRGYVQAYSVLAEKEGCVLLPRDERDKFIWNAAVAKKRGYGFGQSLIWYASEEKAKSHVRDIAERIRNYSGENWIDVRSDD